MQESNVDEKRMYLHVGIDDSPIFLIDRKWVIQNFHTLWQHIENSDMWMISQDFSYGILVSRYPGYLEYDPNPKEIIYAVTKWGM